MRNACRNTHSDKTILDASTKEGNLCDAGTTVTKGIMTQRREGRRTGIVVLASVKYPVVWQCRVRKGRKS
jgi:hypothetical protein